MGKLPLLLVLVLDFVLDFEDEEEDEEESVAVGCQASLPEDWLAA